MTEIDLRSFYTFARGNGFKGAALAKNLEKVIRLWLAEPAPRNIYKVDALPPNEVIDLMSDINRSIRSMWAQKGAETREKNKRKKERDAAQAANPEPLNDLRQRHMKI
tara:strand:+ start:123 stop:446 length:324 start_codon:yes stop_codon:yes gene_type:complete